MPAALGQVGPYTLVRHVGSGGMADVYLAESRGPEGFSRYVCIKRLKDAFSRDDALIKALADEARVNALIDHPNVAQVFELGRHDDALYVVMEFVAGCDLAQLLRASLQQGLNLPIAACLSIIAQAARGLDAAHRQTDLGGTALQLVHRDISPQNLLMSLEGDVKIADFGVAKSQLQRAATEAGVVKGKFNYLSPEQACGEPVDARTDIFALGIVLYELLVGAPFYRSPEPEDLVREAQRPPKVRLRKRRISIPREVEKLVARCLAGPRNRRFQSAGALAEACEDALSIHYPDYAQRDLAELMAFFFPDHWSRAHSFSSQTGLPSLPPSLPQSIVSRQDATPQRRGQRKAARTQSLRIRAPGQRTLHYLLLLAGGALAGWFLFDYLGKLLLRR